MAKQTSKKLRDIYHAVFPDSARNFIFQILPSNLQEKITALDADIKLVPPNVTQLHLPGGPVGPSRFDRRVNKLCAEEDWIGEEWLKIFDDLGESHIRHKKHRKAWEWVQGIYALQQLNLLHEEAIALGVGAGIESVLYYLANYIKLVVATDIYGEGEFVIYEAPGDMLINPERFAKIPYRKDHLQAMYMDGRHLDFPDNHFDFSFSFSSIEHFGGHVAATQAVQEMARVVKPGGAVVLTTEVVLNGIPHDEYFLPEEIDRYLIKSSGLEPVEDIDYSISENTLADYVDTSQPDYITQYPHLVLKIGSIYFTSLSLVLQKA